MVFFVDGVCVRVDARPPLELDIVARGMDAAASDVEKRLGWVLDMIVEVLAGGPGRGWVVLRVFVVVPHAAVHV